MASRYSSLVSDLESTVLTVRATDGLRETVDQRNAQAVSYLRNHQFELAANSLGEIADILSKERLVGAEAIIRFRQARAYAKLSDRFGDSIQACHAALSLSERTGNRLLKADVCLFLAKLEIAHENYSSALQSISQATDIYETLYGQNGNLMACYHVQGLIAGLLLQFSLSKISFTIAHGLAKMVGDRLLVIEIEQHQSVMSAFENGEPSAEVLHQLISAMTQFGQKEINAHRLLNSALEELTQNKLPLAKLLAERSLIIGQQEQSADGFCRYLIASLILAEIHDAEKSKISVLKVLLRCKTFVENHFGNQSGNEFMRQYLDSFHTRWGQQELRQVVSKYYALAVKSQPH